MKALVEAGSLVDQVAPEGYGALMGAASRSREEVARYLLSKGASRTLKSPDGETATEFAKDPKIKALLKQPAPAVLRSGGRRFRVPPSGGFTGGTGAGDPRRG